MYIYLSVHSGYTRRTVKTRTTHPPTHPRNADYRRSYASHVLTHHLHEVVIEPTYPSWRRKEMLAHNCSVVAGHTKGSAAGNFERWRDLLAEMVHDRWGVLIHLSTVLLVVG